MKLKKFIIYISLFGFVSCTSTSETKITKISDSDLSAMHGLIYALPKTNLSFQVDAIRTDIIPGPYHNYAEKYIGISDVPHNNEMRWQISNIEINSYNDIDANEYYKLSPSGNFNIDLSKLINNGIIFPVNNSYKEVYENQFYGKNRIEGGVVFKDLSVTKYIGEEQVTYFKRVQRDSIFAKVPVVKTQSVHKTFDQKAEEAASFIFMIREKRFELLSGMADYYPDGKALEVALGELNRLENEYLDLFIGKRYTSKYSASFDFTPELIDLNQPNILFRFSEEKGVLPANDLSGRPIVIELEKVNEQNILSKIDLSNTLNFNNLFYRLPVLTHINVKDGNIQIAGRKVNICQYGEIILFPAIYLMDSEKFIEFYYEIED
ncbi:MAG: DUF4831 family protein [Bacteroidales bacterium]|nr:DUF4831 family protein [Bacteroidales bacterium]